MNKKGKRFLIFIACLIIVYLVAGIGSIFTTAETKGDWYNSVRPAITPPNWVFPIVWNILFFLIALSLYFSWINAKNIAIRKKISWAFGINFALNVLWSVLYFGMHNPLLALFDIILLALSIIFMMKVSWKISRLASWLLLPYLLWVCFASVLNFLSI